MGKIASVLKRVPVGRVREPPDHLKTLFNGLARLAAQAQTPQAFVADCERVRAMKLEHRVTTARCCGLRCRGEADPHFAIRVSPFVFPRIVIWVPKHAARYHLPVPADA